MRHLLIILALTGSCFGDVSHILSQHSTTTTTPPPPPRPYNFQYQAGRYPGHVDRVQQESGDEYGHVHGSYSYIDPKQKLRTVQYSADDTGFHASLINFDDAVAQPVDSEAVRLAKERHFRLYQRIAEANLHGVPDDPPRDTSSVARAKERHTELFRKIADEHAAISERREAERRAYEATSVPNDVHPDSSF